MHNRSWRDEAACYGTDPDAFFPLTYDSASGRRAVRQVQRICHTCPVTEQCLRYAVRNGMDGIWAGTTPEQRRLIRSRVK